MGFSAEQWLWSIGAAILVGLAKTGMPGIGLLSVPMMAQAFGPRLSVGALLPMLIMADVFAVAWFRRHCQWPTLVRLAPWVLVGLFAGAAALYWMGESKSHKDLMGMAIGMLILAMLAVYLLNLRAGGRLSFQSPTGLASSGVAAGFSTTVANAAGPVMGIYLTSANLKKEEFIGTGAWYFFIVNVTKLPILAFLTHLNPAKPLLTVSTLSLNAALAPAIVLGAVGGKQLLSTIPQKTFEVAVLVLAAGGAIKLLIG